MCEICVQIRGWQIERCEERKKFRLNYDKSAINWIYVTLVLLTTPISFALYHKNDMRQIAQATIKRFFSLTTIPSPLFSLLRVFSLALCFSRFISLALSLSASLSLSFCFSVSRAHYRNHGPQWQMPTIISYPTKICGSFENDNDVHNIFIRPHSDIKLWHLLLVVMIPETDNIFTSWKLKRNATLFKYAWCEMIHFHCGYGKFPVEPTIHMNATAIGGEITVQSH